MRRRTASGSSLVRSSPRKRTTPCCGWRSPSKSLSKVVLPPPLGPSTTAVPSADADPAAPRLRLPETARPVRYRATLTLVPDRDDFDGVIEIDLDVQEQMRVLWLNADDLTVRKAEARVEGKTVAGR